MSPLSREATGLALAGGAINAAGTLAGGADLGRIGPNVIPFPRRGARWSGDQEHIETGAAAGSAYAQMGGAGGVRPAEVHG